MPRTTTRTAAGAGDEAGSKTLPKLQHRLMLNRFFCRLLGAESVKELRQALRTVRTGYDDDGLSYFCHILKRQQGLKLKERELEAYDRRIRGYVERMNRCRYPHITLTYYQWLALLCSEAFLDRLAAAPRKLTTELNALLKQEQSKLAPKSWRCPEFEEADLSKIAFWAATGSGKTLLMHVHLWQHAFYHSRAKDEAVRRRRGVLLITPNEGLTRQHLKELRASGIEAVRYGEGRPDGLGSEPPVLVLEITKLTEKKRGGGQSVNVSEFEGFALILVDEGHRGASGEAQRKLRASVGSGALTIEYSATFGQIVNGASAAKKKALLPEYAKSILFDFSYPHFYEDGYGKDYFVLNSDDDTDETSDYVMLANLLSFYEQSLAFAEHGPAYRDYHLEAPLWVFVGNSVTGGSGAEDDLPDVVNVVGFLGRYLRDRARYEERIRRLLKGETPLGDAFHERFSRMLPLLREKKASPAVLYDQVVRTVFHAEPGEALRAVLLKNAPGEIGLRAGAEREYFGVINIGKASDLLKLLAEQGLETGEENIVRSLFAGIDRYDSPVNILIGSRKFMEGWDCFRVASLGLMNIGRGEGSQIVQLFGRGVRLHGKGFSLKRTSALPNETPPPHIRLLETLSVFGVRASYMAQFKSYLREEGIEPEFEEIPVPIRIEKSFLERDLFVLRLTEEFNEPVCAAPNDGVTVRLDLRPKVEMAGGSAESEAAERVGQEQTAELQRLAGLFDWQRIYFAVLDWRQNKELPNLVFSPAALREILTQGQFEVLALPGAFRPADRAALRRVEAHVVTLLCKYLAALYDRTRKAWEKDHLRLVRVDEEDPNLGFGGHTLKVPASNQEYVRAARERIAEASAMYERDVDELPTAHLSRHLYQPLLRADALRVESMSPPGLNASETHFVRELRNFLNGSRGKSFLEKRELFLLRNLTVGKGVSFFSPAHGEAFYPDFILWLLSGDEQRIVFVDPHGIQFAKGERDPKINLHLELRDELTPRVAASIPGKKVSLDSYIIAPNSHRRQAATSWAYGLTEEQMEEMHVLFNQNEAHIERLLTRATTH